MGAMEWSVGYARQADADFKSWDLLQSNGGIPVCHKLQFLQMACEKLCKAHLIAAGTPPEMLQTSHGFIAGPLPTIIKSEILRRRGDKKRMRDVIKAARHLAQEIELLNPAVDRHGQRPDNCEYPWEDQGRTVHSPLDWTFHPSQMLTTRHGPTVLKLIRTAIDRLL